MTTASRGATAGRIPAGRAVAKLADVPDCQRRDGFPEPVKPGAIALAGIGIAAAAYAARRRSAG